MFERTTRRLFIAIILVLTTLTLLSISIGIYFLHFYETPLEYNVRDIEINMEKIEDTAEVPEDAGTGGYVEIAASPEATIHLADNSAEVFFQNPSRTNQDVALQLYVDERMVAATDLLPPGYQIRSLTDVDTSDLESGTYEGKFVIQAYDPETAEKQIVNAEIDLTVFVEE